MSSFGADSVSNSGHPMLRRQRRVLNRAAGSVPLHRTGAGAVLESLEQRRLLAADFDTLGNELAGKLESMQTNLLGALNEESKVPFLNEHLDEVQQLTLFSASTLNALKSQLNGVTAAGTIKDVIFGVLGPPGAKVLADRNGDNTVNLGDIGVSVNDAAATVAIDFELGKSADDIALPFKFGLGLPGIPFNVTSSGAMVLDLDLSNSGVSFNYADSGAVSINPGTITVGAEARLASGGSLNGTFGFLQGEAKDPDGNSHFTGDFTVGSLTGTPTVAISGDALVDMHLRLGAGIDFPSLHADLRVDWDFNTGDTRGAAPSVQLNNVGIGLGSFFSEIAKPMLENVMYFTEPHQPIIDVLKARIPGLSDGTNAIGLGDVSIESLVKLIADIPGVVPPDWKQYIELATTIIDLTDIINKTNLTGPEAIITFGNFDLNTANPGVDMRNLSVPDYGRIGEHGYQFPHGLSTGNLPFNMETVKQKVAALGGSVPEAFKDGFNDFLDKLNEGIEYTLPILDNPTGCAFKLLLGQDADLATFKAEVHADAGFEDETDFKIFGYGIEFGGQIEIDGKFRTAYDTFGLRQFLGGLGQSPPQVVPGRLLQGLYIDSTSFLTIGGDIHAGLSAELGPIAGVDVKGGIRTARPFSLRINDPNHDGKLRPFTSEINQNCVMKADGLLEAYFEARVHVGVTIPNPFGDDVFIGIDEELLGGTHKLIDFGDANGPECLGGGSHSVPAPPVLGGIVGDGQLQLYVGPNAHKRQNVGNTTDGDETYTVTHIEGTAGDEKVSVTAFGYTQVFEHVKSVWGDGASGKDVVTLELGVLAPATLLGGGGDDSLSHNGPGRAEIRGGTGNDSLTGGDGNDSLYGDDGDDRLSAGGGNNHVEGNAGKDLIFAGDGTDSLFGGLEDDTIHGGGGADSIQGNDGNDFVEAGGGNDTVVGGDGTDILFGGDGNDSIAGEKGNDSLIGGMGSDILAGNASNDLVAGDELSFDGDGLGSIGTAGDADTTHGDAGDDFILSQGGNDSVRGHAGIDIAFGGEGNDSVWGDEGNDFLFGDAGDDDVIGGDGADAIQGGAGPDVILGDNGTITSTGQTMPESTSLRRNVVLASNAASDGNDTIVGVGGADSIYGQGGDDLLAGATDDDYIEGNQGEDIISGGDGDDDLIGGSSIAGTPDGADLIQGFAGHDVVTGDNALVTRNVNGSSYARYVTTGMQNNSVVRSVNLHDLDTIGAGDDLQAGDGDDSMHGQLGDDEMQGNNGHDDMTGHLGADTMNGGAGDDGLIGDKGTIAGEVLDGSTQQTISSQDSVLTAIINEAGTRRRLVTLIDHSLGSADVLVGGLDSDYVHGGAGGDQVEGDDPALAGGGNDALFGDLGADVINGGPGGDHLYGGAANDSLNGGLGADTSYGGDGDDSLWADTTADRLVDWLGNFNNFYVPGNNYGVPTVIRSATSAARQFLADLAAADGSWNPDLELNIVAPSSNDNSGKGGRTK